MTDAESKSPRVGQAPAELWVTHGRRYGTTLVHKTRADAMSEQQREKEMIDVLRYVPAEEVRRG